MYIMFFLFRDKRRTCEFGRGLAALFVFSVQNEQLVFQTVASQSKVVYHFRKSGIPLSPKWYTTFAKVVYHFG